MSKARWTRVRAGGAAEGARVHLRRLAEGLVAIACLSLPALALAEEGAATAESAAAASSEAEPESSGRTTDFYLGFFTAGSWAGDDASGAASGTDEDHSFYWGANLGAQFPIADALDLRLEFDGSNERRFTFFNPSSGGSMRSDIEAWTFFGNFWFVYPLSRHWPDVPVMNRIAPFGGGGLGLSRITFDATDGTLDGGRKQTKFAWQGGVGLSFEVTRWLIIDARYQYTDLGKASTPLFDSGGTQQGEIELDLGAHEILGGPRFVF